MFCSVTFCFPQGVPCAPGSVGLSQHDEGASTGGSAPLQEAGSSPLSPSYNQRQHPEDTLPYAGWHPYQQAGMPQAGNGGVAAGGGSNAQQRGEPEPTEEEKAAAAAAAAEERRREDAVLAQARKIREVLNAAKVGGAARQAAPQFRAVEWRHWAVPAASCPADACSAGSPPECAQKLFPFCPAACAPQVPAAPEPKRGKTHWDCLLEEMAVGAGRLPGRC